MIVERVFAYDFLHFFADIFGRRKVSWKFAENSFFFGAQIFFALEFNFTFDDFNFFVFTRRQKFSITFSQAANIFLPKSEFFSPASRQKMINNLLIYNFLGDDIRMFGW